MLDDPQIDAVYISLPNSMHVDWSCRALEAGKHVLCEKPLGIDPAEVSRAFEASERAGRLLVEAFMCRLHPQTAKVRGLLAEGAIGPVRFVRSTLSFALTAPETDIRGSVELEGGALMDTGCYCTSAFRLLVGEPQLVHGHASEARSGVDMRFVGTLVGPDGVVGQFDCGMDLASRHVLEIVGGEGTIIVPDPWHCRGEPIEVLVDGERREVATPVRDVYRVEFESVSRAIREGGTVEFGRDDAVAQAAVLKALRGLGEGRRAGAGRRCDR